MNLEAINNHYEQQAKDMAKIAKDKRIKITCVLKLKHKYMAKCKDLYMLSLYAIKYGDGTDARLQKRAFERKEYYLNKLKTVN